MRNRIKVLRHFVTCKPYKFRVCILFFIALSKIQRHFLDRWTQILFRVSHLVHNFQLRTHLTLWVDIKKYPIKCEFRMYCKVRYHQKFPLHMNTRINVLAFWDPAPSRSRLLQGHRFLGPTYARMKKVNTSEKFLKGDNFIKIFSLQSSHENLGWGNAGDLLI